MLGELANRHVSNCDRSNAIKVIALALRRERFIGTKRLQVATEDNLRCRLPSAVLDHYLFTSTNVRFAPKMSNLSASR